MPYSFLDANYLIHIRNCVIARILSEYACGRFRHIQLMRIGHSEGWSYSKELNLYEKSANYELKAY